MSDSGKVALNLSELADFKVENQSEYQDYLNCLEMFWSGDFNQVVRDSSSLLASEPFHSCQLPLYRLWTEALIRTEDYDSLNALDQHFLILSTCSDDAMAFRALRGMIHLSLDNWEACELIWLTIGDYTGCNYCLEFLQYYYNRITPFGEELPVSLLKYSDQIADYLHWNSVSQYLLWDNRISDVEKLCKKMSVTFKGSPDEDYFRSQISIENHQYADALPHLTRLCQNFPDQKEFNFLKGFVEVSLEQYEDSLKSLCHDDAGDHEDVDVRSLRGYSHFSLAKGDVLSFHWEKALKNFEAAENDRRSLGLPVTDISYLKGVLTNQMKQKKSESVLDKDHRVRYWIYSLSPAEQSELNVSKEKELGVLYKGIGPKAGPFDLVFMVSADMNSKNIWKLSALYYVSTDPVFHPLKRQESALNLVKKFSVPVSLDLVLSDEKDRRRTKRRDDMSQYRMLEIDEAAFDTIRSVIKEESQVFNESVNFDDIYSKSS